MLSERSETNKEGVGHLDEHDYFHITLIRTLQFTVFNYIIHTPIPVAPKLIF